MRIPLLALFMTVADTAGRAEFARPLTPAACAQVSTEGLHLPSRAQPRGSLLRLPHGGPVPPHAPSWSLPLAHASQHEGQLPVPERGEEPGGENQLRTEGLLPVHEPGRPLDPGEAPQAGKDATQDSGKRGSLVSAPWQPAAPHV